MYSKITSCLLSLALLIALSSCDPAQSIRIENATDTPANIEVVFKSGKHYYEFEDQRIEDTLNITLDPENPVREFHFGIGHWKVMNSLDSLVAMVESITISTENSTQSFKGQDQIQAFFEDRVKGNKDQTILISLK